MAQRDGAAVEVDRRIDTLQQAKVLEHRNRLRREGLIELDGLDIVDGHVIILGKKGCRFEPASEDESERIASGSCTNMNGVTPLRAEGFNSKAPEPSCGTFESCLFCEYFAVHEDFEDIHKLLSLKEALNATSMIRNDSEHHEAVVKPAMFRIDEILGFVSKNNPELRKVIRQAEDEIEMGNYNRHWSRQIEILTRLASSAGRGL